MGVRRSFAPEFKAEVVAPARRGDRSIGGIFRDMDLVESAVRRWVAQAKVGDGRPAAPFNLIKSRCVSSRKSVHVVVLLMQHVVQDSRHLATCGRRPEVPARANTLHPLE